MKTSIVRQLILKDLQLMRPMIIGALAFGTIGVALMPLGDSPLIGWLVLFIAVLLLGIFAAAVGVALERKDRVHLFVLTLPASPRQYVTAKLAANGIAFLVPTAVLGIAAVGTIAFTDVPDGYMPFLTILLLYAGVYYSFYLAVSLVTDSAILTTAVIVCGNTAPIFIIPALLGMPEINGQGRPSVTLWTADVLAIIASEIVLGAAAIAFALYVRSRQRDFI